MSESQIRQQVANGELNVYEAAWMILEIRRPYPPVSRAHPDDQDEVREIVNSLMRDLALR